MLSQGFTYFVFDLLNFFLYLLSCCYISEFMKEKLLPILLIRPLTVLLFSELVMIFSWSGLFEDILCDELLSSYVLEEFTCTM